MTDASEFVPSDKDALAQISSYTLLQLRYEQAVVDAKAELKRCEQQLADHKRKSFVEAMESAHQIQCTVDVGTEDKPVGYKVTLESKVHAAIPHESNEKFDPKRWAEALTWISANAPHISKSAFIIEFGLKEAKRKDKFRQLLEDHNAIYAEKQQIPWQSLTSLVKELMAKKLPFPAELLGVDVYKQVVLEKVED